MSSLDGNRPSSSAVISLAARGACELLVRCPCAVLSLTLVSSSTVKSLSARDQYSRSSGSTMAGSETVTNSAVRRSVAASCSPYTEIICERSCQNVHNDAPWPGNSPAAVISSRHLPRVLVSSTKMISRSLTRLRRIATNKSVRSHRRNGARDSRSSVGTLMNRSVSPLHKSASGNVLSDVRSCSL